MPGRMEWGGWTQEALSTEKQQSLVADLLGSEGTLKKVLRFTSWYKEQMPHCMPEGRRSQARGEHTLPIGRHHHFIVFL